MKGQNHEDQSNLMKSLVAFMNQIKYTYHELNIKITVGEFSVTMVGR